MTLMELLPPTGWGDVATRQHVDLRFQIVDQRFEALEAHFDARFAALEARFDDGLDARLAQSFSQAIRWTVATMIALTGVTATIATMIARLG